MKKPAARPSALFITCASLLIACTQTNTPQTSTTVSPGSSPSPATSPQGSAAGNSAAIPVGVGVAQTSNVALLGQEQVAGAKIAEKYFNDKGGVDGTPIRLVFQDTGGDEQGTINRPLAKIFYDIIKDFEFFKMSVQISSPGSKILWL